jgi:hypothetical protein
VTSRFTSGISNERRNECRSCKTPDPLLMPGPCPRGPHCERLPALYPRACPIAPLEFQRLRSDSNTVRPAARTLPPSPLTPFGEGDCGDAKCSVCLQDHGRSPRMPKATPNYGLEMHPMASSGRRAKKDRCMRVTNIFHAFCPVVCCCRGFPKWINVRIASGRSSRARMSSGHSTIHHPTTKGSWSSVDAMSASMTRSTRAPTLDRP